MLGINLSHPSLASEDERETLRPPSQIVTAEQEEAEDDSLNQPATQEAEPVETSPTFEQRLQDPAHLRKMLEALGIDITEDNIAARFWDEQDLHERLVNNQHGAVLNLTQTSFSQTKSLLIFDALRDTKSVRHLDLSKCRIPLSYYLALGTALSLNTSLQVLNLRDSRWPNQDLNLLGLILQNNHSLNEIILPTNLPIEENTLHSFYKTIGNNQHLRLIHWPSTAFKYLKALARTNPAAMVHLGASYLEKLVEPEFDFLPLRLFMSIDPLEEAITLFTKADQHKHPLGSYELGKIKESQKEYQEALKWYQRSAALGYAAAQYKLSKYYRADWPKGKRRDPNYKEALEWARKSAKQGFPQALYRLGRLHEHGKGVPVSLIQAGDYYYEAMIRGYPKAFLALGTLCRNPHYEHASEALATYYLEWGKKFPQVRFQAERLLRS